MIITINNVIMIINLSYNIFNMNTIHLSSSTLMCGIKKHPFPLLVTAGMQVAPPFTGKFLRFMKASQHYFLFGWHMIQIQFLQTLFAKRIGVVQYPFCIGVGDISIVPVMRHFFGVNDVVFC